MNRTVQKIKQMGTSVMFLIATIAFTLYAVLTIVGAVSTGKAIEMVVKNFAASESFLAELVDGLGQIFSLIPISALAAGGFDLLIALGMWMYFFSCRSPKVPVSTAGLVLIKTVKILYLILFFIGLAAGIILSGLAVYGFLALFSGEISYTLLLLGVLVLAVILLGVILAVAYISGILKTIRSVRMTLNTGIIMGKVSAFVIFINYVIGAVLLVGAVLSPTIIGLLGGICGAVAYVTCSVAMGSLRSEMQYIASRGSEAVE